MHPHQERVILEKSELDDKLLKLTIFIQTEAFSNLHNVDRILLRRQRRIMHEYSEVLKLRIAQF